MNPLIVRTKYSEVFIRSGITKNLKQYLKPYYSKHSSIFILADNNTVKHCLPVIFESNQELKSAQVITIIHGENFKNIETVQYFWDQLIEKGCDRNSLLINVGGGVITDLGGFVASTFKRGISYINIPTSLLAMVDASVGGKTGFNLDSLKNQIGTFYHPKMVIIEPQFLKTLPNNQLISGYAEIIKHGLLSDNQIFNTVVKQDILSISNWDELIFDSIQFKEKIVEKDPEEHGLRKILNLGHTVGHAVESYFLGQKGIEVLHGEAVAFGLIVELFISHKLKGLNIEVLTKTANFIFQNFPEIPIEHNDIEQIIKLLAHDKKNENGEIGMIFLKESGYPVIEFIKDKTLIENGIEYYSKISNNQNT